MSKATRQRRQEVLLLPECLDDYVSADNPVRALDQYVETLDLAKLEFDLKAESSVGRPVEYRPHVLLKILVYGYLNQIRSSRKLEKQTKVNLEVIWLTEKAQPDHWTINDFRKRNTSAFKQVLRNFHKVCDVLELFGKELLAGDGSFFKALNNKAGNFTEAKLDKLEAKIDAAIEAYDQALEEEAAASGAAPTAEPPVEDKAESEPEQPAALSPSEAGDKTETKSKSKSKTENECEDTADEPSTSDSTVALRSEQEEKVQPEEEDKSSGEPVAVKNLRAKGTLEQLQAKKQKIGQLREQALSSGSGQASLNDPDSRLLKKGSQSVVGHNVQCGVDAKNTLIAHIGIAQAGNDANQLEPLAREICAALGIEPDENKPINFVADAGYSNHSQMNRLEDDHIQTHVPEKTKTSIKTPGYQTNIDFHHDPGSDEYVCPRGERLQRHKDTRLKEIVYRTYYNTAACRACPVREQCTKGKYRKIKISEYKELEEKVATRMEADPEIYARRKELAELPFGTIKSVWGYRQFMVTGTEGCEGELNLAAFCFNWKRVLNLVGMERLLEAIRLVFACIWALGGRRSAPESDFEAFGGFSPASRQLFRKIPPSFEAEAA